MPHFLVDDDFAFHRKTIRAGNAAVGLWTRAGAFCQKQGTDGVIFRRELTGLGTTAQAKALVEADLWHLPGHGCGQCPQPPKGAWIFHDWLHTQKTAAQAKAEREAARERMRRLRNGERATNVRPNKPENDQENSDRSSATPSPSPLVVPSSRHLQTVPGDLNDDDLTAIAGATGGDVHHAARVAADILGRATEPPSRARAYVLRAVGQEPDRYRMQRRLTRDVECDTHPGQFADACNGCAADRKAAR